MTDHQNLQETVEKNFPAVLGHLGDLVRIPSVSWDGFDPEQVQSSAEAVAALMRSLGIFDQVRIESVPDEEGVQGQPAVLALRAAKDGRPTVLLYAHHDVQPPGDNEKWDTPPFEPTVRNGRIYGRGASDDKAGIMTHFAALQALAETAGDKLQLGLAVFIEGEEEFGSKSFKNFLKTFQSELSSDVIIVADSDNWDEQTPSLTVSLRGNATFQLRVKTLEHASHSGMYGGAAVDATLAFIKLANTFWNADGTAAVAGLKTHEAPTPELEKSRFHAEAGLVSDQAEIAPDLPVLSKLWNGPAITVTGIDVPSVKNASNTLTPEVTAKVSVRIAPGQNSAEAMLAIREHIEQHMPFGAEYEIFDLSLGEPFLVDSSGEAARTMLEAFRQVWGAEPVLAGVGGSIPFIADLAELFPETQILVTGVEDPQSRAHSPNESQSIEVLRKAILSEALFLSELNRGED